MKQLQSISVVAPGFSGLNTQDSSVSLPNSFSLAADNCVIDKYGRILGDLHIKGFDKSLNQMMIDEGYAWSYMGDTKVKDFPALLAKRNSKA